MVPSARSAAAGFAAAAYRPPSACAMTTDREWATMSCISRAIRDRSAAVAICACWSRSTSRRSARSRMATSMARLDLRTRPKANEHASRVVIRTITGMELTSDAVSSWAASTTPTVTGPTTAMPQAIR